MSYLLDVYSNFFVIKFLIYNNYLSLVYIYIYIYRSDILFQNNNRYESYKIRKSQGNVLRGEGKGVGKGGGGGGGVNATKLITQ